MRAGKKAFTNKPARYDFCTDRGCETPGTPVFLIYGLVRDALSPPGAAGYLDVGVPFVAGQSGRWFQNADRLALAGRRAVRVRRICPRHTELMFSGRTARRSYAGR